MCTCQSKILNNLIEDLQQEDQPDLIKYAWQLYNHHMKKFDNTVMHLTTEGKKGLLHYPYSGVTGSNLNLTPRSIRVS